MTQWEAVVDVLVGGEDGEVIAGPEPEGEGIDEDSGVDGQPGEDCPF